MRVFILVTALLLQQVPALAKVDPQADARPSLTEPARFVAEADLEGLVSAMNDFLSADRKYRSDTETPLKEVRRELAKLKEKGVLKLEFDPRRLSDDDLAAKIRRLSASSPVQVAGPTTFTKAVHASIVCLSLLTGKCARMPELRIETPGPSITIEGSK